MIKTNEVEHVGQFNVQSGNLRITDPCYKRDTWCAGVISDVKNGVWESHIKMDDSVAELIAYHKDIKSTTLRIAKWKEQGIDVGVDSGQCGIFDADLYPEGETGNFDGKGSFYDKCCRLTTGGHDAGVLDFGVVSRSGYGDGSYTCYTLEDVNGVVGVKIVFIDENDVEDEFDYDRDEDGYNYRDDEEN